MIKQEAVVIAVNDKFTKVEATEITACGNCSAHHICQQTAAEGKRVVDAINQIGAKVGQKVIIQIDSSSILKGSFIVFLIPTVLMLLGIFSGYFIGLKYYDKDQAENFAVLAAVILLTLSYFIIKKINKKLDKTNAYYPVITEVIN